MSNSFPSRRTAEDLTVLEDSDPATSGLVDVAAQARWLGEIRGAAVRQGVPVVINARIDVHLRQAGPPEGRLAEALRRGRAYLAAGADCVFPIMVSDEPTIRAFVSEPDGPINTICEPDPLEIKRLAELGIPRISFGGDMHRLVTVALEEALARIGSTMDGYKLHGNEYLGKRVPAPSLVEPGVDRLPINPD